MPMLIDDFDSLDEEEPVEAQHSLGGLNSRIIANGMEGFLESGTLNEEKVGIVIKSLLDRERKITDRVASINEEYRKQQLELKSSNQKVQNQENEIEKLERMLHDGRARELKQLKRIDAVELKLREKTEQAKKLSISLKNQDSKFKIDKRKLESENGRFKDKLSDFSRGPSTREKRSKMELVINAKGNLSGNTLRQGNTSALAIDRMQKQIGSLSDENSKLRSSLVTAQEQICETLERFPNFKAEKNVKVPVDGKVHELENVVARNCEKFRDLLGSLNKHNVKQLQDLASDYQAKCERDMAVKVAALERKVEEVKAHSEEKLFAEIMDIAEEEAILQEQDIDDIALPHTPSARGDLNLIEQEDVTPDNVSSLFGKKKQARSSVGLRVQLSEVQLNSPDTTPNRHLFKNDIADDSLEL